MLRISIFMTMFCSLCAFAQSPSFDGNWNSSWENGQAFVALSVKGNHVTGGYSYNDQEGAINATISDSGKILIGIWKQFPNDKEVNGDFLFFLADDGQSFSGYWWHGIGVSRRDGGYWNGVRAKSKIPAWLASGLLSSGTVVVESNKKKHSLSVETTLQLQISSIVFHVTWQGDPRWRRLQPGTVIVHGDHIHLFIPVIDYTKTRIMNYVEGSLKTFVISPKLKSGKYQVFLNQTLCGAIEIQ